MFFKNFFSIRIKDIIFLIYHEDMMYVRDLLMDPQNRKTISGFIEYCYTISATVLLECANPKSASSLKRAVNLVKKYDIAMTEEQIALLNEAIKTL